MSTDISAKKPQKGRPSVDSEAVNVRIERPQLNKIDEWRRSEVDIPTRPEAIRRLIDRGLEYQPDAATVNAGKPATRARKRPRTE